MRKIVRKIRRAITLDEPGYYDMYLNEGERFFARLYLHHIRRVLAAEGMAGPLKLLDAGCQTGRLAIPLAKDGHRVTGVDTGGIAIHKARQHARDAGIPLQLVRADLGRWLPKQTASGFDAVICNEVLYLRENWRELLQGLIRLLRPGGLCFISHRPTGYYLVEAFQQKDWEAVRSLLSAGEGKVLGSYYNWQDREELDRVCEESGIQVLEIVPVGFLSWLAANPEKLTEEQRDLLFEAELASLHRCSGSGRYLLVCGKKR